MLCKPQYDAQCVEVLLERECVVGIRKDLLLRTTMCVCFPVKTFRALGGEREECTTIEPLLLELSVWVFLDSQPK